MSAELCPHKLVNCVYQTAKSLVKEPSTIASIFSDRQLSIKQVKEDTYNVYEKKDELVRENVRFIGAQIYVLFWKSCLSDGATSNKCRFHKGLFFDGATGNRKQEM